jgi:hypothetical protein
MTITTAVAYVRAVRANALKPGDMVDFTRWRLGARVPGRTARIAICPKCGRKGRHGALRSTRLGPVVADDYTHTMKFRGWAWDANDSCYLPRKEAPGLPT